MIENKVIETIEAILKKGNDVQIQRKGDGYVVLEVSKTIRAYSSSGYGTVDKSYKIPRIEE